MRLNLQLSPSTEPVPFDHLHRLTGALHKWLGANDLHDGTSLYSFGWLRGGRPQNGRLAFPNGAAWRISFFDPEAARAALAGLLHDPAVMHGMRVVEAREQAVPAFGEAYRFKVDGPVVARRDREDGSKAYLLWDEAAADEALTRALRWKLQAAGFEGSAQEATVRFDRSYGRARTKLAQIKGVKHKGSECPVIVEGTPEAVRFAWLVGVGELTGSGFGALQ